MWIALKSLWNLKPLPSSSKSRMTDIPHFVLLSLGFFILTWIPHVHILNFIFFSYSALCHFNYSTSHKTQEGKERVSPPSQLFLKFLQFWLLYLRIAWFATVKSYDFLLKWRAKRKRIRFTFLTFFPFISHSVFQFSLLTNS